MPPSGGLNFDTHTFTLRTWGSSAISGRARGGQCARAAAPGLHLLRYQPVKHLVVDGFLQLVRLPGGQQVGFDVQVDPVLVANLLLFVIIPVKAKNSMPSSAIWSMCGSVGTSKISGKGAQGLTSGHHIPLPKRNKVP
jgi:hypothetical protein